MWHARIKVAIGAGSIACAAGWAHAGSAAAAGNLACARAEASALVVQAAEADAGTFHTAADALRAMTRAYARVVAYEAKGLLLVPDRGQAPEEAMRVLRSLPEYTQVHDPRLDVPFRTSVRLITRSDGGGYASQESTMPGSGGPREMLTGAMLVGPGWHAVVNPGPTRLARVTLLGPAEDVRQGNGPTQPLEGLRASFCVSAAARAAISAFAGAGDTRLERLGGGLWRLSSESAQTAAVIDADGVARSITVTHGPRWCTMELTGALEADVFPAPFPRRLMVWCGQATGGVPEGGPEGEEALPTITEYAQLRVLQDPAQARVEWWSLAPAAVDALGEGYLPGWEPRPDLVAPLDEAASREAVEQRAALQGSETVEAYLEVERRITGGGGTPWPAWGLSGALLMGAVGIGLRLRRGR